MSTPTRRRGDTIPPAPAPTVAPPEVPAAHLRNALAILQMNFAMGERVALAAADAQAVATRIREALELIEG